jgi:hypothetical protein
MQRRIIFGSKRRGVVNSSNSRALAEEPRRSPSLLPRWRSRKPSRPYNGGLPQALPKASRPYLAPPNMWRDDSSGPPPKPQVKCASHYNCTSHLTWLMMTAMRLTPAVGRCRRRKLRCWATLGKRLYAVERALPDCEVLLHTLSTSSRVVPAGSGRIVSRHFKRTKRTINPRT